MGLDLIAKLHNDLTIFIKRQQTNQLEGSQQQKLAELEAEGQKLAFQAEELLEKADFAKIRIDLLSKEIIRYEGQLNAQGGAFAQTKTQEKIKVETLLKEKERLERALRQECDGSLPYALAPNILGQLLKRIAEEAEIKQAKSFEKELEKFLAQLKNDIAFRTSSGSSTQIIATEAIADNLKDYMAAKRRVICSLMFLKEKQACCSNQLSKIAKKRGSVSTRIVFS